MKRSWDILPSSIMTKTSSQQYEIFRRSQQDLPAIINQFFLKYPPSGNITKTTNGPIEKYMWTTKDGSRAILATSKNGTKVINFILDQQNDFIDKSLVMKLVSVGGKNKDIDIRGVFANLLTEVLDA
jgi:hypothetical protein